MLHCLEALVNEPELNAAGKWYWSATGKDKSSFGTAVAIIQGRICKKKKKKKKKRRWFTHPLESVSVLLFPQVVQPNLGGINLLAITCCSIHRFQQVPQRLNQPREFRQAILHPIGRRRSSDEVDLQGPRVYLGGPNVPHFHRKCGHRTLPSL